MNKKWKTIGTAPRNETVILAWFGKSDPPYAETVYFTDNGDCVWVQDSDSPLPNKYPTHWMEFKSPEDKQ